MPTPDTIKTDNGKSFLDQTFRELPDEMEQVGSHNFTLTRGDGKALALMTTDPNMIGIIEELTATAKTLGEEDGHVG